MRTLLVVFLLAAALAGCSLLSARGQPPVWTGTSNKPLNTTVSCVITGLNTVAPGRITHSAQIIEPDRVLEVAPQQVLTVGAELYYVTLTVLSPAATRLDLNSSVAWTAKLQNAIAPCATSSI
jgi:hypothetical protein